MDQVTSMSVQDGSPMSTKAKLRFVTLPLMTKDRIPCRDLQMKICREWCHIETKVSLKGV